MVVAMTLAQPTVLHDQGMSQHLSEYMPKTNLFSDAGESTSLAALVHWLRDPVDARVPANLNLVVSMVARTFT